MQVFTKYINSASDMGNNIMKTVVEGAASVIQNIAKELVCVRYNSSMGIRVCEFMSMGE